MNKTIALAAVATVALAAAAPANAQRNTIQVVGSSTVFPFSSLAAERFGQTSEFAAPVVE